VTGSSVTAEAGRTAAPARSRRRAALAWTLGSAAAAAALFACYLRQSRTVAVGSDGASQALQAWDLLHGNLLLRGWWVTDVSFYTTELPQYALIELARGLTADVVHVAGALTYTLLVLAAALLAKGTATGPGGAARALVAAGIMLAPQLGPGTQTLVLAPDHTGTSVPVLLVFLLIDRGADRPRRVAAGVWLGLAWTALADAMAIFVAVIPLALVCAARLVTGRAVRRRRDAVLLAAALLAVPAELAAAALIRAAGGWQVNGLRTALAGPGQLAGNARLAGEGLLELFGADVFAAAGGVETALAVLHLAGLALAAAGVLAAARGVLHGTGGPRAGRGPGRGPGAPGGRGALRCPGILRPAGAAGALPGPHGPHGPGGLGDTLVDSVLLAGIAVDLAAYLAGVQAVNILSAREIAPVLPFAAVLAGRSLGGWLADNSNWRPAGQWDNSNWRAAGRRCCVPALRYGLGVVLALYLAGLGYAAARPPAAPQCADLAAWLRAHGLTAGLSGYHQANIVTLETGGAVTLRAVTAAPAAPGTPGRLVAYTWNASAAWYAAAAASPAFLVLTAPGAPGGSGLTAAQAVATFGRPARTYRYKAYVILVWHRAR
jgi:hypothetical protein